MKATDQAHELREQLEAERRARHEAERVAAENARALYDRQDELELLEMVAASSNEATAIEPALGAAIVYVCAHMRWPVGHAYLANEMTGALQPTGVWYLEDESRYAAFRAATEERVVPVLPNLVAHGGEPVWFGDFAADDAFGRRESALEAGLRSGLGFPILIGTRSVGVLEFFSERPTEPDPVLLSVMAQIGVQLGRVVERDRARAELERSNADLEAFAYLASHDLTEPLRSVAGFVSLLERRYAEHLDDQAREIIAYALDGTQRMQAMIDDLLLYARAGSVDLQPERVAVRTVVDGAVRALESAVNESGATIEIGPLPEVNADPGQLERVFQNLLGNALKYTASDVVPHVSVQARELTDAWEVAVADNGIGIAGDDAERVFDMFARAGGGADYQGTGLGLAISRRIVERHGGRLWVEPGSGGGSTFRLTLPR
jgi:signal transduction histidine kinase